MFVFSFKCGLWILYFFIYFKTEIYAKNAGQEGGLQMKLVAFM